MSTTFTWTVTSMDCYPKFDDKIDVVFTVYWTLYGMSGTHGSVMNSTCVVSAPEGTFTPYDQLTQEQVLGWIWANGVNKDATEAAVQQQIDNQINPPVVTPPLPWSVSNEI